MIKILHHVYLYKNEFDFKKRLNLVREIVNQEEQLLLKGKAVPRYQQDAEFVFSKIMILKQKENVNRKQYEKTREDYIRLYRQKYIKKMGGNENRFLLQFDKILNKRS
tara:strand:- start:253 stop:576 length:324 start_codon:yes stop_codon:yes gene_type:complete